jgi:hypothetical protein
MKLFMIAGECTYLEGAKAHTQYSRHHFELCDVSEAVELCSAIGKDCASLNYYAE